MFKEKGKAVLFISACLGLLFSFGCSTQTAYNHQKPTPLVDMRAGSVYGGAASMSRVEESETPVVAYSPILPAHVEDYALYEDGGSCSISPEAMVEKAEIINVDLNNEQYVAIKNGNESIHQSVLENLMRESSSLALKDDFSVSGLSVFETNAEEKALRNRDELSVINSTKYDIPITINRYVINVIHFYLKRHKKRFELYLARSRKYTKMVHRILKEEGLPLDLAYLPLIESGYSPKAYSWAHASGLWQFIAPTGRTYGLKINWWLDERRDAEKSTRAAAKFLKKLYAQFGDWKLVLASYNAGENRVARSIRKAKTKDFWKLRLPRQTRNYVPAFMAATVLAKNYKFYGFKLPEEVDEQEEYEEVLIKKRAISLRTIARYINVDYKKLSSANLEVRRGLIPYLKKGYMVKVPKAKKDILTAALLNNKPRLKKHVGYFDYKVARGDNLYDISRRYGISLREILAVNDLGSGNYIRPGLNIKLPLYEGNPKARRKKVRKRIVASRKKRTSSGETIYYRVKRGDTLSGIAVSHGVRLSSLKKWNRIRHPKRIRKGQKLVLYLSGKHKRRHRHSIKKSRKGVYTVRKGDTLWDIAESHKIKLARLLKQNGLRNNAHIFPGDRLKVPVTRN